MLLKKHFSSDKVYFKITEVANEVGISTSLIRFWEKSLGLKKPEREGVKRIRVYERQHIETFKLIKNLIRRDKYTLKGVQKYLKTLNNNPKSGDLLSQLREMKEFLESIACI